MSSITPLPVENPIKATGKLSITAEMLPLDQQKSGRGGGEKERG